MKLAIYFKQNFRTFKNLSNLTSNLFLQPKRIFSNSCFNFHSYQANQSNQTNLNRNNSKIFANSEARSKMFNFYFFNCFFLRTIRKKIEQFRKKNVNNKIKNRSSLKKRVKIVGPQFDRNFLFRRVGFHHKRYAKSKNNKKRSTLRLMSLTNRKYLKSNFPMHGRKKYKCARA